MDFLSELRAFIRPPKRGTPLRFAGVIAFLLAAFILVVRWVGFGQDLGVVLRTMLTDPIWLAMALLIFSAWAFFASARQEDVAISDAESRLGVVRDAIANLGRMAALEHGLPQCKSIRQHALDRYTKIVEFLPTADTSGNYEAFKQSHINDLRNALENVVRMIGTLRSDASALEPKCEGPAFEDFAVEHEQFFHSALERDQWKRLMWRKIHITEVANTMIHELDAELRERREKLLAYK